MTQQKSENPIVPEGPRKSASTRAGESQVGGGKGIPVNEVVVHPELPFATAENPETEVEGANVGPDGDRSPPGPCEVPKAKVKRGERASVTMEYHGRLGGAVMLPLG